METRWIAGADLERPETVARTVDSLEAMFRALPSGALTVPARTLLITGDEPPQRQMLVGAAAWPARGVASVKVTTLTPANPEAGRELIQGLVVVMDLATGQPVALIEGGPLTGLRTGALAGLAARHLAGDGGGALAMIGAGVQARCALRALLQEARFDTLRLASRGAARRDALAQWVAPQLGAGQRLEICESVEQAVAGAGMICSATSIDVPGPVIRAEWMAGAPLCIALGGANEDACEFDPAWAARAQVIVEDRAAALEDAGELRAAALPPDALATISEILNGAVRPDLTRPRLFRSVGHAAEDLAGAVAALGR